MRVHELLTGELGLPSKAVDPYAALAESPLGDLSLVDTVDDVRAAIGEATPVHVLPVGTFESYTLGIHLRPTDVEAGSVRLVRWIAPDGMMDVGTLRDVAGKTLLELERAACDADRPSADPGAYTRVNALFGGDEFTPDQMRQTLFREAGTAGPWAPQTGAAYADLGMELRGREEKRALFDRARQALPDLMYLHLESTRNAAFSLDFEGAAKAMDDALQCWHHTAFVELPLQLEVAQMLLDQSPDAFGAVARDEIAIYDDDAATAAFARRLASEGGSRRLVKLLNDRGHFHKHYTPALTDLAKLYRHLGWDWALELLALRPSVT